MDSAKRVVGVKAPDSDDEDLKAALEASARLTKQEGLLLTAEEDLMREVLAASLASCSTGDVTSSEDLDLKIALEMSLADEERRKRRLECEEEAILWARQSGHVAIETVDSTLRACMLDSLEEEQLRMLLELSIEQKPQDPSLLVKPTSASTDLTTACVSTLGASPSPLQQVTDDCTGEVERTVKASLEGDVRRLHVSWSRTASNEEIFAALVKAIQSGFHLSVCVPVLKYKDDEGDNCTLTDFSVPDFLNLSRGGILRLYLQNDAPTQTHRVVLQEASAPQFFPVQEPEEPEPGFPEPSVVLPEVPQESRQKSAVTGSERQLRAEPFSNVAEQEPTQEAASQLEVSEVHVVALAQGGPDLSELEVSNNEPLDNSNEAASNDCEISAFAIDTPPPSPRNDPWQCDDEAWTMVPSTNAESKDDSSTE